VVLGNSQKIKNPFDNYEANADSATLSSIYERVFNLIVNQW